MSNAPLPHPFQLFAPVAGGQAPSLTASKVDPGTEGAQNGNDPRPTREGSDFAGIFAALARDAGPRTASAQNRPESSDDREPPARSTEVEPAIGQDGGDGPEGTITAWPDPEADEFPVDIHPVLYRPILSREDALDERSPEMTVGNPAFGTLTRQNARQDEILTINVSETTHATRNSSRAAGEQTSKALFLGIASAQEIGVNRPMGSVPHVSADSAPMFPALRAHLPSAASSLTTRAAAAETAGMAGLQVGQTNLPINAPIAPSDTSVEASPARPEMRPETPSAAPAASDNTPEFSAKTVTPAGSAPHSDKETLSDAQAMRQPPLPPSASAIAQQVTHLSRPDDPQDDTPTPTASTVVAQGAVVAADANAAQRGDEAWKSRGPVIDRAAHPRATPPTVTHPGSAMSALQDLALRDAQPSAPFPTATGTPTTISAPAVASSSAKPLPQPEPQPAQPTSRMHTSPVGNQAETGTITGVEPRVEASAERQTTLSAISSLAEKTAEVTFPPARPQPISARPLHARGLPGQATPSSGMPASGAVSGTHPANARTDVPGATAAPAFQTNAGETRVAPPDVAQTNVAKADNRSQSVPGDMRSLSTPGHLGLEARTGQTPATSAGASRTTIPQARESLFISTSVQPSADRPGPQVAAREPAGLRAPALQAGGPFANSSAPVHANERSVPASGQLPDTAAAHAAWSGETAVAPVTVTAAQGGTIATRAASASIASIPATAQPFRPTEGLTQTISTPASTEAAAQTSGGAIPAATVNTSSMIPSVPLARHDAVSPENRTADSQPAPDRRGDGFRPSSLPFENGSAPAMANARAAPVAGQMPETAAVQAALARDGETIRRPLPASAAPAAATASAKSYETPLPPNTAAATATPTSQADIAARRDESLRQAASTPTLPASPPPPAQGADASPPVPPMPTSTREAKLDLDSTGRNASDNPAEPIFGSDTPRNEPALRVHQAQAPGALPNRADHIRAIALQLADGAAQAQNRAVELRLNPEELGRVRLSIISGDGGITVNITAERGETLDLMRRNISQLEAEFRGIGYSDIQFSFEGGGDTAADDSPGERDAPAVNDPATTIADAAPQAPKPSATPVTGQPGLDLRL